MLWDIIRDFFVIHIFGGCSSTGDYYEPFLFKDLFTGDDYYTSTFPFYKVDDGGGSIIGVSFGDYFSLIATIISMVAIVLICCMLIKKIYNMCAHIIG